MNWKFIFNTNHAVSWGTRDKAAEAAVAAGYKFLNWNGNIWAAVKNNRGGGIDQFETGITVNDCF